MNSCGVKDTRTDSDYVVFMGKAQRAVRYCAAIKMKNPRNSNSSTISVQTRLSNRRQEVYKATLADT
jgi:hypothetical protein